MNGEQNDRLSRVLLHLSKELELILPTIQKDDSPATPDLLTVYSFMCECRKMGFAFKELARSRGY